MKTALLLLAILLTGAACSDRTQRPQEGSAAFDSSTGYVEAERNPPAELEALNAKDTSHYQVYRGGTLRISGKRLEVRDAAGALIAANDRLIRLPDEGGSCPSDGLNRIVVKADYFTVEQQTCSGMLFVDEYVTFRAEADGSIYLHRFATISTDRSDPDRAMPERSLTVRDFGKLRLQDTDIDRLYALFQPDTRSMDAAPMADTMAVPVN